VFVVARSPLGRSAVPKADRLLNDPVRRHPMSRAKVHDRSDVTDAALEVIGSIDARFLTSIACTN
jgi:hypothetical protein